MVFSMRKSISIAILLFLLIIETAGFAAPKVRVGWYPVPGLNNYDKGTKEFSGYNYDYLKAVAQYTGWDYEFVVEPFSQCLEDMKAGKIDLIGGVSLSSERAKSFDYMAYPTGRAGPHLVTQSINNNYAFEDFEAFNGMTIGVIKGSHFQEILPAYAKEHNFTCEIEPFVSQDDMERAFKNNEVDAVFISGTRTINKGRIIAQLPLQDIYFISRKDAPWIKEGFDKALVKIRSFNRTYDEETYTKYFSASYTPTVAFSAEERAYLKKLSDSGTELTVLYDPAWIPLDYQDPKTKSSAGIVRDLYDLISLRTGIKFKYITANNYDEAVNLYGHTADIYSLLATDYDWGDVHNVYLTQPVLKMQIFRVYNNNPSARNRIALPTGYYITRAVKEHYKGSPDKYQLKFYDTMADCIDALRNHEADSTYVNAYELNYYMDKFRMEHMNVQSVEGFTMPCSIGVSKQAGPVLLSIMSRTINSISSTEMDAIILSQTNHRLAPTFMDIVYANPITTSVITGIVLIILALAAFFFYKSRQDRKQRLVLQAANNAKTEFLNRMSHDIRTPMNAIMGMTALATRSNKDPEVADCLNKIDSSSQFLLKLINDILDMSVIEKGEMILHPEVYPMSEFAALIQSTMEPLAAQKNITFSFYHDPALVCLVVDKLRFNQIFINLIGNSIKFTPEAGKVSFSLQSQGTHDGYAQVRATVADNGIGISQKFIPKLFDPFTQEKERHIEQTEGSGLGLSIVKKMVETVGGKIYVQSAKGKGTTFTIDMEIPTAPLPTEKATETTPEPSISLQGVHVLIAEDNMINQEVARRLLESSGVSCDIAANGQIALDKFTASTENQYDAIFMDVRMPVMDGLEATKKMRALPRADAKTIPIIALTADAYLKDSEHNMAAGMTAYLSKPVQPKELISTLKRVLEEK
jgi:two-component system sensor histidine kinase EvgS